MKKITSMIFAAFMAFGMIGCRDAASLEGLEDQTKEDGVQIGETEASKSLEEFLVNDAGLQYNWVTNYTAGETTYKILFDFNDDDSVLSDSPSSDSESAMGLFRVGETVEGEMFIRFDGAVMLADEMIDPAYRETQLIVESYDENAGTVSCKGVKSGTPVILSRASETDIAELGAKVVWAAFIQNGGQSGVLRDQNGAFKARFELDRTNSSIELTWVENEGNQDARHENKPVTLENGSDTYTISWEPVQINGQECSSMTYDVASKTVSFGVQDWTIGGHISASPDFVDGANKHYYLGGHSMTGSAHPDLWSVIVNDKFRDIYFYPYADDIPVQVRAYITNSTYAVYLFVNDYYTSPSKTPRFDMDKDWIRFYASQQGDFTKLAVGDASPTYSLDQMATDLKAFTDFYFHEDGLYIIPDGETDFYLISKTSKLWVKVSSEEGSDLGEVDPEDNLLEVFIRNGMSPYGTIFEEGTKNFKMHYDIDPAASEADLIWIENEDVYTDGNYKDMAVSKAKYKTVGLTATQDGKISFDEPVIVGDATFKGMTWRSGNPEPDVEGMECSVRVPIVADGNPLDYFFTYGGIEKYQGGNPMYLPWSRFCLPTSDDNITGLSGTDRYIFYPFVQEDGSTPAGPMSIEIFPVGKEQAVTIKSWADGMTSHVLTVPVADYSVEKDIMFFTKGTVSGSLVDETGKEMTLEESEAVFAPIDRLLFSEVGFHVYKAESVSYDSGKHYFYLVSPDPEYPYWIKVRED